MPSQPWPELAAVDNNKLKKTRPVGPGRPLAKSRLIWLGTATFDYETK